ncbi:hypothetical protein VTJ49DRAFT_5560 [Mycothermus thermophilus]|uniref:MARVEL domain-containing protein n=1 Tax=Humicola insolens TaxID=85995 RepID=A0ABR3V2X0_HUMIN
MEGIPPKYTSPPRDWKSKFGLRLASILFLIIVGGLAGSLAANDRVEWMFEFTIAALCPAIGLTLIWDVAEAICLVVRGGNRGIHPGAIVGIDLLMWLGWICEAFLFGLMGLVGNPRHMIVDHSGWENGLEFDESLITPEDYALENEIRHKGRAIIVFIIFMVIVHFTLFVIGCYETHMRRFRIVYVMQPIPEGQPQVLPMGQVPAGQTQTQQEKAPRYT